MIGVRVSETPSEAQNLNGNRGRGRPCPEKRSPGTFPRGQSAPAVVVAESS